MTIELFEKNRTKLMNILPAASQSSFGPAQAEEKNHPSNEEIEESLESQTNLKEFKKNVEITGEQLIEFIQNDQFTCQAEQFNQKAVELMNQGFTDEGSILLSEAEKILEYAANRGKQINRNLIITVLHNEAYCHQQTWNLERCANYIQALIYNLNCEIKHSQNQQGLVLTEVIQLRNSLAHYYLLFCAINSQLKRNDAALIAAKNANSLLKTNSIALCRLATKSRTQLDPVTMKLLGQLSKLQSSAQNLSVQKLLYVVRSHYHAWHNKCGFPNFQLRHLFDRLKDFSIGNIMQMDPLNYCSESKEVIINMSLQQMLQRVVKISISYFTMATELRLLAVKFAGSKEAAKQLSEYRQSQCYHLIAIILILYYLPFEMLYLKHILTSFQTHYSINIQQLEPIADSQTNPQELFQILLTDEQKEEEYKGSTAGNSEKAHSSRNSYEDGKKSNISKLQSYVRASLKSQQFQSHNQLAKLNNYYYVKGELAKSKQKLIRQQKSTRSSHHEQAKKRAFLTSKQSAQKSPVGFTPSQLSPKRSKCSSKSSRGPSKRGSIDKAKVGVYKTSVIEQYFQSQINNEEQKTNKMRNKSKKKTEGSKENKDYTCFSKLRKAVSPVTHTWRANNLNNQIIPSKGTSKQNYELKAVKSASKFKGKLAEAKSKKKPSHQNR